MPAHAPVAQFGVHLSGFARGVDPAAEAKHIEALGFDLVAIDRDVMGGPTPGLEVWTTLTWVAARTTSIKVVPNVLVVPNRHPVVVAKMAETLDRLSGGRLVLALGAGAPMNDSVLMALGLAVLSPGQRVNATGEALEVMRGLWTETEFSYTGEYFRVGRGRLEPRPERSIPVWLGAYGPRMLELTGRLAGGWIPSMFVLGPDEAYAALDRVRRSAWDAGRDPDTLTYAYNVSVLIDSNATSGPGQVSGAPADVADELADFVRHGFTCLNFWLLKNTPDQLERLAADVLPRVRDHLA